MISISAEKISYLVDHTGAAPIKIIGNYWAGTNKEGVILLHMMPSAKESWNDFAEKLNQKGYHVIAIDLRGHGESAVGGLDYRKFTDTEHQESICDVIGARSFLVERGIAPENICIGGASIGANLALQYMVKYQETKKGFLLSPGLDYKGIKTDEYMRNAIKSQGIYMFVAKDDTYSANSVMELKGIGEIQKKLKIYKKGGHGTTLFETHRELTDELLEWISKE